jgi:hypothetical protein
MMGLLDRIRGRKKDDLNLDNIGGDLGGMGGMPGFNEPLGSPDQGFGMQSPMEQPGQHPGMTPEAMGFERMPSTPSYPSAQHNLNDINLGKDLEIISAKLDSIKAELDSMSQRIKRLERLAEGEGQSFKDKWNY